MLAILFLCGFDAATVLVVFLGLVGAVKVCWVGSQVVLALLEPSDGKHSVACLCVKCFEEELGIAEPAKQLPKPKPYLDYDKQVHPICDHNPWG